MKLYFNGCSFVHGDDLVWDYSKNPSSLNLLEDSKYLVELTKHRLSSRVATKLGIKDVIDEAERGASNQIIAFKTLEFFHFIPKEQRKDYIACIGWTAAPRLTFVTEPYLNLETIDITILPMWIENMQKRAKGQNVVSEFLRLIEPMHKPFVLATNEHYWFKEHIQQILMLQQFFEANEMKYVFWNSIDNVWSNELWFKTLNQMIDWNAWIDFQYGLENKNTRQKKHLYEHSWGDRYYEQKWKTKSNHPNHASVEVMSTLITEHLKKNGMA